MEKKTSQKKIEANRKNARKSTGPKSAEGKRRVSKNAVKHGILSKEVVIKAGDGEEDEEEFNALYAELWEELNPRGPLEKKLVERIAICYWRLRRALRAEVGEIRKDGDATFFRSLIERWDPVSAKKVRESEEKSEQFHRVLTTLENPAASWKREMESFENSIDAIQAGDEKNIELAETLEFPADAILELKNMAAKAAEDDEQAKLEHHQLFDQHKKDFEMWQERVEDHQALEVGAKELSRSLPSKEAVDKILRYETAIERQLYKAINELERLQRRRQGEIVPPPINVDVSSST